MLAMGVVALIVIGLMTAVACGVIAARRLQRARQHHKTDQIWRDLISRNEQLDHDLDRIWQHR